MNQATTYELLIAQKLQELAVPEQADAIWATIEQQLTIEMPSNSSSGSGGSSSGSTWWIGGSSLFTLFVAVITYVFISKQNLDYKKQEKEIPAIIQPYRPKKNTGERKDYGIPPIENPAKELAIDSSSEDKDSENNESFTPGDSIMAMPVEREEPILIPAPKIDTVAPIRKTRGVKGIGDGDYRLVPGSKKN